MPGGVGMFTSSPAGPCDLGKQCRVSGAGSGGQQGVYLFNDVEGPTPPPIKLADLSTAIPDGTGDFVGFPARGRRSRVGRWPSSATVRTASRACSLSCHRIRRCHRIDRTAEPGLRIADTNRKSRNGHGDFTGFVPPNPVVPPNPIQPIRRPSVRAWWPSSATGEDDQQGIYLVDSAGPAPPPIVPVADITTAIPDSGGAGNFSSFERLALENSDVAFVGRGIVVPDGSMDAMRANGRLHFDWRRAGESGRPQYGDSRAGQPVHRLRRGGDRCGQGGIVGFGDGGLKGLYTNFGGSLRRVDPQGR